MSNPARSIVAAAAALLVAVLPGVARAEGPLRLEVGSAAELRLHSESSVMPSARVGAGLRFTQHMELSASLRHAFFFDDPEAYKQPVAYDDLSLGVRFGLPAGAYRLHVEPAFVVARFSEGTGEGERTGYKQTYGLAFSAGVERRLGEHLSIGAGLGLSYALGSEDFDIALVSAELHAGWRF
jgi:hypothetical protein